MQEVRVQREFVATRMLFGFTGVVLAIWALISFVGDRSPEAPLSDTRDAVLTRPHPDSPAEPSWEEELQAAEIQAIWRERRLLLADLSHRYREEPDSARAAIIRREMDSVIVLSERDVYHLRLRNARRAGHQADTNRIGSE